MKNKSKHLGATWMAAGLWIGGNFLLPSQPAISQHSEVQQIPSCTQYTEEIPSPVNCGNQVNGKCTGTWLDGYDTAADCNHGTRDDDGSQCKSSPYSAPGTLETGPCVPIQGGTPAICQPGPATAHYTTSTPNRPDCLQYTPPPPPPTVA